MNNRRKPLNDKERGRLLETGYRVMRNSSYATEFPDFIKRIVEERAWEGFYLVDENGVVDTSYQEYPDAHAQFDTLLQMIEGSPPAGWGCKIESVEKLMLACKEDQPEAYELFCMEVYGKLANHGEIGNGRERESRGDTITSTSKESFRGTGTEYLLRRIRRDAPEQLADVHSGRKSAYQVAKELGWKRDNRMTLSGEPEADIEKLRDKFGDEYIERIARQLLGMLIDCA